MVNWDGEKRMQESLFFSIVGRKTKVIDIPGRTGELGFTGPDGNIHEAYDHYLMDGLTAGRKTMFRLGVFAHEMLHQIFTDFNALEETLMKCKTVAERKVTALFANLIEDPAIEYEAPLAFKGAPLKALRFMIAGVYTKSPGIDNPKSPFSELVNALIHFGDMGIVKGNFTSDEAFRIYRQIAPEFGKEIEDPVCADRIEAARRWMELSRPLWEKEEDLDKAINRSMNLNGKSEMSGDGEPQISPDREDIEKAGADKGKSEIRRMMSEGEGNGDGEGSGSGKDRAAEAFKRLLEEAGDIEEASDSVADSIKDAEGSLKKEEAPAVADIKLPGKEGTGCVNIPPSEIEGVSPEKYFGAIRERAEDINILAKALKKMLSQDEDEYIRSSNGRYNIKRGALMTTARIFDKKRSKKDLDDTIVGILLDESGSMTGEKMETAKNAAIVFAEVFARLSIPCYIMGFTADTKDAAVKHDHFVTWKNSLSERQSLSGAAAQCNNYDGFSLRYLAEIIKRKQAAHKIMFVISDGMPSSRAYRSVKDGVEDTAKAITEAKKAMSVFGIGIGDCRPEVLQTMYKETFIHVSDINELAPKMAGSLKKILRTY